MSSHIFLRNCRQLMVSVGCRASFLNGCDSWLVNHTAVDSSTPRSLWPVKTEVDGFKIEKKGYNVLGAGGGL